MPEIRDSNGALIAFTTEDYQGNTILNDKHGVYLGLYNPNENETRDKYGVRIGTGNLLGTLIN